MTLSPATHSADDVVRLLRLEPLPREGGFFRRTGEASSSVTTARGERAGWSTILGLFTPRQFSAWHRLAGDEIWAFHAGDPIEVFQLRDNRVESTRLGPAPGDSLQHLIPGGDWQGARVAPGGTWSLVTCMVVPGFHWDDFELGRRETLEAQFPGARELILQLTR